MAASRCAELSVGLGISQLTQSGLNEVLELSTGRLICQHLRDGLIELIGGGQMRYVPTVAPVAVERAVARDAVAKTLYATELLDVDVQQLARALALLAHHGC